FKYVNIHPDKEKVIYEQLRALFKEADIDPDYYLAIDASSDLPYDVYHAGEGRDRKSTRLNSSHVSISYAVFCLKKKKNRKRTRKEKIMKVLKRIEETLIEELLKDEKNS